ncbi:hypothetical protein B2J88_20985 [Rhodococcus sp. SRB_17]|uniref:hypothetical protein n=1 Tax=Acidovorax sp. SRB_24 TaxID=1962700 RepID=UPI00145F984B|nr:hypothetical protein [Acidovorax sp. SRB_24]NMM77693.1 hypothetical protein [Acidovorax sp. SRB_24]NMM86813.1 hypothetical protein [Rhodococcus sp. SRB_17]
MISFHPFAKLCAATAAASVLLAACGGGNDSDPTPSNEPGVLTVTASTLGGINGIYGNGALNLTDVEKKNPIGSQPEVCTFKFDGANKVAADTTAFGDIRYQPNANVLYAAFLTFSGKEYAIASSDNTVVARDRDQVRFENTAMTATDGSNNTIRVNGIVPMRTNRPAGC